MVKVNRAKVITIEPALKALTMERAVNLLGWPLSRPAGSKEPSPPNFSESENSHAR
jgi:hypothetical protein